MLSVNMVAMANVDQKLYVLCPTFKCLPLMTAGQTNMADYSIHILLMCIKKKCVLKFLTSHKYLTLNEGQGHPSWYQHVEFSGLYHLPIQV